MSAEMLSQSTRTDSKGTTFYEFDYTLSTTRGDKRIISAVAVANRSLYIVNANVKCEGMACREDTPIVTLARESVKSFEVVA